MTSQLQDDNGHLIILPASSLRITSGGVLPSHIFLISPSISMLYIRSSHLNPLLYRYIDVHLSSIPSFVVMLQVCFGLLFISYPLLCLCRLFIISTLFNISILNSLTSAFTSFGKQFPPHPRLPSGPGT